MRFLFIINPVAGKGELQKGIVENIKASFKNRNEEYKIVFTSGHGDAVQIAQSEAQKGDSLRIFAAGGEGTVFETLNGIAKYDNVELGVIPCGSANDFLKYFGEKAAFFDIDDLVSGICVSTDLIKAGDKFCLNGCSVGMDAMVAHDMSLFKNWPFVSGKMAYKLAIVKTFLKPAGVKIKISLNGNKPFFSDCLFAVVANAPYYGGGYQAAPEAVPFDGKLNFTLVDTISRLKVPKFLKYYERGEHGKFDFCHHEICESMEFWCDKEIPVNLDGEIEEYKNMRFELVKSAVKFILPKSLEGKILTNV